jgi:hypothetical protein
MVALMMGKAVILVALLSAASVTRPSIVSPRPDGPQPSAETQAEGSEELRFSFDPTDPTREHDESSVYLVVGRGGEARAVLFED